MKNFKLTSHVSYLKSDPIVSSWLLSIDASPNTERNYLQAIKVFCEFTEKRLTKLFWKLSRKLHQFVDETKEIKTCPVILRILCTIMVESKVES